VILDDSVLDDVDSLVRLDPGEMLRAVATGGAQVREALLAVDAAALAAVAADGRPRAVVVTGMGGSGVVADVVTAVAGAGCPVPIVANRGYQLPGWVGSLDLVVAVSCSGSTEETLSAADAALRRGCRVVTVGAAGSPLAELSADGRATHLTVDAQGRMPRANLWGLAVPALLLLDAVGLADVPRGLLSALADRLDEIAEQCGPMTTSVDNPAKAMALQLGGSLPFVWGASDIAAVAAGRFACQLPENAKYPAVHGALTEVHHNQVVAFAGAYGALGGDDVDDLFRDRVEDGPGWPRIRLVLLRDAEELPPVAARADASAELAEQYGVPTTELRATGDHAVLRLASLVAPTDFASVYLALLQRIDPTPIEPIAVLKGAPAAATGDDDL
jgi:glucose/mannose-6-phosphate isomerase